MRDVRHDGSDYRLLRPHADAPERHARYQRPRAREENERGRESRRAYREYEDDQAFPVVEAAEDEGATPLARGCTLGSVSMTCYGVGIEGVELTDGGKAAAVPGDVPADQTNQ